MSGRLLQRILLLILLVQPGGIQGQAETIHPADAGWTLGPRRQLRQGVDLWPRIVSPQNAATRRVNAAFRRMNRDVADQVRECDAGWAAFQEAWDEKPERQGVPEKGDWEQTIKLTMNGPRFLSFTAIDFNVCDHSYPNTDRLAFVFDMRSGELVDWTKHVAESANGGADSVGSRSGNERSVSLPGLEPINARSAVGDCKNAFAGEQAFLIWPDARRGRLVALATDLPHVVQGCAEEIALTTEEARKLGFDEDLLTAIDEAHRRSLTAAHSKPLSQPSKH